MVTLSGLLVCSDRAESDRVATLLPVHRELSRAERGCLQFDVEPTDDPLIFRVTERFSDAATFRSHQHRVANSDWGRATAGIERRYTVAGLDDSPRN